MLLEGKARGSPLPTAGWRDQGGIGGGDMPESGGRGRRGSGGRRGVWRARGRVAAVRRIKRGGEKREKRRGKRDGPGSGLSKPIVPVKTVRSGSGLSDRFDRKSVEIGQIQNQI